MTAQTSTANPAGASVVITHHVVPDRQAEYEVWLDEIGPVCRAAEGLLDWHIIRPIAGYTDSYSVMIRYQTEAHLKQWMDSAERQALVAKVTHLLSAQDQYHIRSGLDFLFTSAQTAAKPPVRWKQFLVTWSAIFPLVCMVPLLLIPLLDWLGLPDHRVLHTFFVTGVVVSLMVYAVMPRYTRWVHAWLFR